MARPSKGQTAEAASGRAGLSKGEVRHAVRRFGDVEALRAAYPHDLAEKMVAVLRASPLAEGERLIEYEVIAWETGEGKLTKHGQILFSSVIQLPETNETVRRVHLVRSIQEVSTWKLFEQLLSANTPPPFEQAAARASAKTAAKWGLIAREWLRRVEALREGPDGLILPEAVQALLANAWIAIEHAYRAGRFMREAELGDPFEPILDKAEETKSHRLAGAAETNRLKNAERHARRAKVSELATGKLSAPHQPNGKPWTIPALAAEVREAWTDENGEGWLLSNKTLEGDLRAAGFLKEETETNQTDSTEKR